jgi:hypothetical protein
MDEDVWMLEERLRLEGLNVYQDVLDPRASWLSRYRRVAGRRHLRHAKERTTLGSRAGEGVIVLGYTRRGSPAGCRALPPLLHLDLSIRPAVARALKRE